jgi:hypothetical protein
LTAFLIVASGQHVCTCQSEAGYSTRTTITYGLHHLQERWRATGRSRHGEKPHHRVLPRGLSSEIKLVRELRSARNLTEESCTDAVSDGQGRSVVCFNSDVSASIIIDGVRAEVVCSWAEHPDVSPHQELLTISASLLDGSLPLRSQCLGRLLLGLARNHQIWDNAQQMLSVHTMCA